MEPTPIPQNQTNQNVNLSSLYAQYGEATVQFKIAQNKVMLLEQQIQGLLNNLPK